MLKEIKLTQRHEVLNYKKFKNHCGVANMNARCLLFLCRYTSVHMLMPTVNIFSPGLEMEIIPESPHTHNLYIFTCLCLPYTNKVTSAYLLIHFLAENVNWKMKKIWLVDIHSWIPFKVHKQHHYQQQCPTYWAHLK